MTTVGRGIRNAFRNATRTVSIILILGLAIGLAFAMLIAHRSVSGKIATEQAQVLLSRPDPGRVDMWCIPEVYPNIWK
jgi:hypothetical protein